jgi:hypothetical protein
MKGFHRSLKGVMEGYLEDFYENICLKNLLEIEKAVKKYEQKIKNMKKGVMMIKDK